MALTELCHYLRNWFDRGRYFGTFHIENGALTSMELHGAIVPGGIVPQDLTDPAEILQNGQYFRIVGSVFNDGVHQYPATKLADEVFDGALWVMAVPPSVITLSGEIDDWQTKYGKAASSPFSVESVTSSSYSRTRATGEGLGAINWQTAFASRLAPWRKI